MIDTKRLATDAAYWRERGAPDDATHYKPESKESIASWWHVPDGCELPSEGLIPRPTKPPEPDRTSPEWSDWKIPSGSWPHWMMERIHRETGRMSYDNPVKGMIRDLWATVDKKPAAPEWNGEGLPPVGGECEAIPPIWYSGSRLRVLCHDEGAAICRVLEGDKIGSIVELCANEVRPIPTKAQSDRDELADLLEPYCRGSYCGNEKTVADAIMAAGWTKP